MFVLNGNTEEIVKLFKPFGLTEYEARAYFTLQVSGKCGIGQLAMKAGIPHSKIYHVIPDLAVKGLVEIITKRPKQVKAVPFLRFANDFLTERKCLLKEIEAKIDENKEVLKNNKLIQILGR